MIHDQRGLRRKRGRISTLKRDGESEGGPLNRRIRVAHFNHHGDRLSGNRDTERRFDRHRRLGGRCRHRDRHAVRACQGFAKFTLFNRVVAAESSYVCRHRDNSAYEVVEERTLTAADRAAGVLGDQIVRFTNGKADARPDHRLRLVGVRTSPPTSRGKYSGGSTGTGSDGVLRIATNLLEVPAEIVALIYRFRWTIEIFFRFFKHVLGCRHLLSHRPNGIEIQTYCAIIACLLISLWTGRKPTLRTYEMICFYFSGLASEAELLAHLTKLKRHDDARTKL